ncbi:MAG: HK97 family phage prohead protease [Parcubacteria group bacterium]
MEHKTFSAWDTKIDNEQGVVDAIFAVMGNIDQGGDIIHNGSMSKTFSERGGKVRLLDQHKTDSISRVLGKPLELRELARNELPSSLLQEFPDATGGAWGRFQFFMDTPEGKGAFIRLKEGGIDQWSIGYDAVQHDFSKVRDGKGQEKLVRNLRQVKLYEVSPVLWGMNAATETLSAKADDAIADPEPQAEQAAPGEGGEPETKAGRIIAKRNAVRLKTIRKLLQELVDDGGLELDDDDEETEAPAKAQAAEDKPTKQEAGPDVAQAIAPPTINLQALALEIEDETLRLLEV